MKRFYAKDAEISRYYNKKLANGKWDHMMDQTHIGYTYWQQPDENKMPEVKEVAPIPVKVNPPSVKIGSSINKIDKNKIPNGTFIKTNGCVAIEANHFSRKIENSGLSWMIIPDYGKTLAGVTISPVTAKIQQPGGDSPHLEYQVYLTDTGKMQIEAFISPTLDFTNSNGLHYAVSIDDEKPQIVNINADESDSTWKKDVADNIKRLITEHHIEKAGVHVLKYWMVDPGVVLQKIVINADGGQPSYLGPPESARR